MTHQAPTIKQMNDEKIARKRAMKAAEAAKKTQAPTTGKQSVAVRDNTADRNAEYRSRYDEDAADYVGGLLKFNGQSGVYSADGAEVTRRQRIYRPRGQHRRRLDPV